MGVHINIEKKDGTEHPTWDSLRMGDDKENASILNLVQLWRDEESRNKMVALAEVRKKALENEVEKISSLDEIKARIMGLTKEEVLNG